jgi:hypothetical protein
MKTSYLTIMVLSAVVILWPGVTDAVAEDNNQTKMGPGWRHRQMVMPEEVRERVLSRIEETNPEKAKELKRLLEEDPNEFHKQLRAHFRQEFRGRMRPQGPEGQDWGDRPRTRRQARSPRSGGKGPMRDRMWEKHIEFTKWLTENYPDKAKRLEQLQQSGDEGYLEEVRKVMKTYGPVMRASRRNPELAGVLKEDLSLKEQRHELLADIKAATDEGEKEQLTKQLGKVVADRFELIIKRKQIKYEELLQRLKSLEKQVQERKTEVDRLKSQKADKVSERLEELIKGTEKVDWD